MGVGPMTAPNIIFGLEASAHTNSTCLLTNGKMNKGIDFILPSKFNNFFFSPADKI
jgi:hypothetical protein